ncbi:hypothetical protein I3842_04G095000 [Carya illinoinensis]|uniref:EF-hand domain-containing protein n=1 Tax=Carya illinoinensis TaxID=32201 RepID=A0A922F7F8_CARIL|nr:hypothetical protein I3842_04G095000 [Carya illinoinensis]
MSVHRSLFHHPNFISSSFFFFGFITPLSFVLQSGYITNPRYLVIVMDSSELRRIFQMFDRNDDGRITKKELKDLLENLGIQKLYYQSQIFSDRHGSLRTSTYFSNV